jgi:hypothetical protein
MLDVARCSYELINADHDSGMFDNITFSRVHNILQKHSTRYDESWLSVITLPEAPAGG